YWQRHSFDGQPEVVALLKGHLTDLAAHHHARAQETKAAEEYAAAARWYRTYLASFPDGEDAAATNFLLAEVLYESGVYAGAAEEYERTASAYPFPEKGGEAGYAALLAYAEHAERLTGAERAAWHRKSIDSALRFGATYPDHPQAAAVETNAAERLFALSDFVAARDVAMRVVRSEEHTSELQSRENLVCRLLLEKKKKQIYNKDEEATTAEETEIIKWILRREK